MHCVLLQQYTIFMKKFNQHELYRIFAKIRTQKDAGLLLTDFLTPGERADIAQRIEIVKMLLKGVPHRTISKKLRVSIAKITRGSRALRHSRGGFRKFLGR